MIALGVFAGAKNPYQMRISNPGTPDSSSVGRSGSSAMRFFSATASTRSFPCLANPSVAVGVSMNTFTSPASNAATAGEPPL
jgi:hypothetical protein